MASIIPGFEYDIFLSYRQKDNKTGWVTEFVENLRNEIESTFKEDISIYFDANPHDGLHETHDVDSSLKEKVKCLIFIPIVSQTYCDPKAFAWQKEFRAFLDFANEDQFGLNVKLANGNVAKRVLPVRIHEIDEEDKKLFENEIGGVMRSVDFVFTSAGVNRPLTREDDREFNLGKLFYPDQINKVAVAIKEIIQSLQKFSSKDSKSLPDATESNVAPDQAVRQPSLKRKRIWIALFSVLVVILALIWNFSRTRSPAVVDESTRIAVLPFTFSGPEELSYLGPGLMDLLYAKIAGIGDFAVLDPNITYSIFKKVSGDFSQLFNSSYLKEQNVSYLLNGSIIKSGNNYQVIGNLYSINGEFIDKLELPNSNLDSLAPLTNNLAIHLIESITKKKYKDLTGGGSSTTSNLIALNDFLKGEQSRREGDYLSANSYYTKAIEKDSAFAMAWLRLWYNAGWFDVDRSQVKLAMEKSYQLREKLPTQTRLYTEAFYDANNGQIKKALNDLESILSKYGDNNDLIFLIGDLIFHCNYLLDLNVNESKKYFGRLAALSDPNQEVIDHLSMLFLLNGNIMAADSLLSKYKRSYKGLNFASAITKFAPFQNRDDVENFEITDFLDSALTVEPALVFQVLNKLDKYPEFFDKNFDFIKATVRDEEIWGEQNTYDWWHFNLLIIQGKYQEAYTIYPDKILQRLRRNGQVMLEKNFQPYSPDLLKALVNHVNNSPAPFPNKIAMLGVYGIAENNHEALRKSLSSLDSLMLFNRTAFQANRRNQGDFQRMDQFYKYLKNSLSVMALRHANENERTLLKLDSIFNNIMPVDYSDLTDYYVGLKLIQMEILFEMGRYQESENICLNLLNGVSPFNMVFIHPILKYRLARCQDELKKTPEALANYKYFYSIYKDCDPFYQNNVAFARRRIEELEESRIQLN